MTTRKDLEAKCQEFAAQLPDENLRLLYEVGFAFALNLTWPMIEERDAELAQLKKDFQPTPLGFAVLVERDELQAKLKVYEEALDACGKIITCVKCPDNKTCEFAYDAYNTNGDCLAEK